MMLHLCWTAAAAHALGVVCNSSLVPFMDTVGTAIPGSSPVTLTGADATPEHCRSLCCADAACGVFTFVTGQAAAGAANCWLKAEGGQLGPSAPCARGGPYGCTSSVVRPDAPPSPGCISELDCQLSGLCVNGTCDCDPGWKGAHCGQLDLLPNNSSGHFAYRPPAPAGAAAPYWNSWGASQPLRDAAGTYHLFATSILNGCGINVYTFNEQLVHATSASLLGPYSFRNVALNTTIINPHVLRVPQQLVADAGAGAGAGAGGDAKFVLFYSGEPLPSHFHKNCTTGDRNSDTGSGSSGSNSSGTPAGVAEPPGPPGKYLNIGCVLSIATASALDAPFQVQAANFTPAGAEGLFCRTNPTAYIFPNGTTLLFFRSAGSRGESEQIWLARAPHYLGPYALVTPGAPVFPNHNEDPFVFRNERGRFLLMLHQSNWGPGQNGAKAYSHDGLDWHFSAESMSDVWSSEVALADGSSVAFARREEPKIYVDEKGHMRAMFNAVADSRGGGYATYVMSQAIAGPKGSD